MTHPRSFAFLAAVLAQLLSGCTEGSDYSFYYKALRQTLSQSFSDKGVSRAEAAAIPYASLGLRIDGGAERILVLATNANAKEIWTSASHIVLTIQGGRIVHSIGLPHDRTALVSAGNGDQPPPAAALTSPFDSKWIADFPDIGAYSVALTCRTEAIGAATITILGSTIRTVRIAEACKSSSGDWSFTDYYWIDPVTGLAWRSQQHPHPNGETVDIEILRPPG